VKAGQIVKVKVLNVDARAKRIALSLKALESSSSRKPFKPGVKGQEPQPRLEDKLAALATRWGGRTQNR
jgi:predicted RNA-binding protein with RPS1 domain